MYREDKMISLGIIMTLLVTFLFVIDLKLGIGLFLIPCVALLWMLLKKGTINKTNKKNILIGYTLIRLVVFGLFFQTLVLHLNDFGFVSLLGSDIPTGLEIGLVNPWLYASLVFSTPLLVVEGYFLLGKMSLFGHANESRLFIQKGLTYVLIIGLFYVILWYFTVVGIMIIDGILML